MLVLSETNMSRVSIPTQDSLFGPWITTFASVATANFTALNMTSSQALQLTGLATAFTTAYEDSQAQKALAQGAVANKDEVRAIAQASFQAAGKFVNANNNVPTPLKAELGITVTPSEIVAVSPPTDLVAVGYDTGYNKLVWKRGGNTPGTAFVIECRIGSAIDWNFVSMTTKTKFVHTGQTPGVQITYRVYAQRDDLQSMPSNMAVLYDPEESSVITLKEAA